MNLPESIGPGLLLLKIYTKMKNSPIMKLNKLAHQLASKLLFAAILLTVLSPSVFAQGVAINADSTNPDPSAILDVRSTTQGMLIPRMTETQRNAIASPALGLLIFQTDQTAGFYYYDGSAWAATSSGGSGGAFATSAGVTTNSPGAVNTDDLVFGSTQLNDQAGTADDHRLYFDKSKGAFRAGAANAAEWDDANTGVYTAAFGVNNQVSGNFSAAWGDNNTVTGDNATAWGSANTASQPRATAFGLFSTASGRQATAWGGTNIASNIQSTAFGAVDTASGIRATAWGFRNHASAEEATVFGRDCQAAGVRSTAWGLGNKATNNEATTWGGFNVASGSRSTAFGLLSVASGQQATAWGGTNIASNIQSTAFGAVDTASGIRATAWGFMNHASGEEATTWGRSNQAIGIRSTAFGGLNVALGINSTSFGELNASNGQLATTWGSGNQANGAGSTVWGFGNTVSGVYATAFGKDNVVDGTYSTAWGEANYTSGFYSSASGWGNFATGASSTASGQFVYARSLAEFTVGLYGTDYVPLSRSAWHATDRLFVVANGFNANSRSDALIIYKNGDATLAGMLTQNSDRRLKTNIKPLQSALENVLQLGGYSYNWKDTEQRGEALQIGVMAQEVQSIYPELVKEGDSGYLSVNYNGLVPVLIEATKEQQQLIQKQQEEITALKALNASEASSMKAQVEDLQGQINQIQAALQQGNSANSTVSK
jgi:hypothetical protein